MSDAITLERVEELAAQLPPTDQLKLVAHIGERLSTTLPMASMVMDEEQIRQQREKDADELLAMLDAAAEMIEGEFDSAEDIRRIREERDEQICPSR